MIASPAAYSPVQNPAVGARAAQPGAAADARPGPDHHQRATRRRAPVAAAARPRSGTPKKVSQAPYFTSWVEDQLVDRYGSGNTFGGGLKIRTTLDLELPEGRRAGDRRRAWAASARARRWSRSTTTPAACGRWSAARTSRSGPSTSPPRATASRDRRSSRSPWSRRSRRASPPAAPSSPLRRRSRGRAAPFKVENYEDRYAGVTSLAAATTVSDNSVYAEVGYKLVGTRAVARVAQGDGRPHPGLEESRDGAGRAEAGGHAARDGQVLRDARRRAARSCRARSQPTRAVRSPTPG